MTPPTTVTYVFQNGHAFLQQFSPAQTASIRATGAHLFADGLTLDRTEPTDKFGNVVVDTLVRAFYADPTLSKLVAAFGPVRRVIVADVEEPAPRKTTFPAAHGAPYFPPHPAQGKTAALFAAELRPGQEVVSPRGDVVGFVNEQRDVVIMDEAAVLPEVSQVYATYRFAQNACVTLVREAEPGQTAADIDSHVTLPLGGSKVSRPTVAEAFALCAASDAKVTMLQTLFGPLQSVGVHAK